MAKVTLLKPKIYRYKGHEFAQGKTETVSNAVAEYLGNQCDEGGNPYFRVSGVKLKKRAPQPTLVEPEPGPDLDPQDSPAGDETSPDPDGEPAGETENEPDGAEDPVDPENDEEEEGDEV